MNDTAPTRGSIWRWLAPVLAVGLLLGMGLQYRGFPDADDAEPYHREVYAATASAPEAFGGWTSRPVEVPPSAIELLRPNAIRSRTYVHGPTNAQAGFLIVQCKDARDLSGHWPPNCYKANGYTMTHTQPRTWTIHGQEISGVDYTFEINTAGRSTAIVVSNFMVLPGVGTVPDMFSVREAGADPRRRHFGAAQVQVVTDASYAPAQRDAIFYQLLGGHQALLQRIVDLPRLASHD
jgi:hypothetical protein